MNQHKQANHAPSPNRSTPSLEHKTRSRAIGVALGLVALVATYEGFKGGGAKSPAQRAEAVERSFGDYAQELNGTHRELTVGDTKRGIVFDNLGSMADYVHLRNPQIGSDTALGVMELSVIQDQERAGRNIGSFDPLTVEPAEGIRIPASWGVGRLVHEENTDSAQG